MFESLYLTRRLLILLLANAGVFFLSYSIPVLLAVGKIMLVSVVGLLFLDISLLYRVKRGIAVKREHADKLSNGDFNDFTISVQSRYNMLINAKIIDELPEQIQVRDFELEAKLKFNEIQTLDYSLRPISRGEYKFGNINVYVKSPLALIERRYKLLKPRVVPVYPSFLQLKKYEFLAVSNKLEDIGIKKIRRIGQNMEFDQIRDYVRGDDFRNINWKATARRGSVMVNQYQDEKSQQIYCLVDKGRSMKMPFNQLTLLDHAINSCLVFSNIAINKDDRAGLITFSNKIDTILSASKRKSQMELILGHLYKQTTAYRESNFSKLLQGVTWHINQRSLLVLFTNFESVNSLQRQLRYLKRISKDHLLLVIFFENTELRSEIIKRPEDTLEVYKKTMAEKYQFEKKLIAKELQKNGIHSILTAPENLTVDLINKYLEFKSRRMI